MFTEPLLDVFSLRGEKDALPSDNARTLAVLGHYVRTFVSNLNETVTVGAAEVVCREIDVMFLHPLPG